MVSEDTWEPELFMRVEYELYNLRLFYSVFDRMSMNNHSSGTNRKKTRALAQIIMGHDHDYAGDAWSWCLRCCERCTCVTWCRLKSPAFIECRCHLARAEHVVRREEVEGVAWENRTPLIWLGEQNMCQWFGTKLEGSRRKSGSVALINSNLCSKAER